MAQGSSGQGAPKRARIWDSPPDIPTITTVPLNDLRTIRFKIFEECKVRGFRPESWWRRRPSRVSHFELLHLQSKARVAAGNAYDFFVRFQEKAVADNNAQWLTYCTIPFRFQVEHMRKCARELRDKLIYSSTPDAKDYALYIGYFHWMRETVLEWRRMFNIRSDLQETNFTQRINQAMSAGPLPQPTPKAGTSGVQPPTGKQLHIPEFAAKQRTQLLEKLPTTEPEELNSYERFFREFLKKEGFNDVWMWQKPVATKDEMKAFHKKAKECLKMCDELNKDIELIEDENVRNTLPKTLELYKYALDIVIGWFTSRKRDWKGDRYTIRFAYVHYIQEKLKEHKRRFFDKTMGRHGQVGPFTPPGSPSKGRGGGPPAALGHPEAEEEGGEEDMALSD